MSENKKDIKEIIRDEYKKCMLSPSYFIKKYCFISHPMRGRIQFQLYPFQEKTLELIKRDQNAIILKSRQLGISTLVAGYILWLMLFFKDKNILVIATKQDTAKNLITKVTFMYDNLPSWLKGQDKPKEKNKLSLKLHNNSQVKASSAAGDAGRSEACSLLVFDEAAFIDDVESIWTSAQSTLSTGGKCIALSTPYGTGNWFHKTWVSAEEGQNGWIPIRLPWHVHPERDQKWRDKQDIELGPKEAAQECFSGDVILYTNLGPKYIKDIKIGDKVLSHDGTYNKVIKTISHISNKAIGIKSGINYIEKYTTLNHPFYNNEQKWEDIESIIKTNNKIELFPKTNFFDRKTQKIDLLNYINSNSPTTFPLKSNDRSIWLTKTSIVNRFIEFDYDLGLLIGIFLSEGSLAKNKVEISFNGKTERNGFPLEVERILEEKFNINRFSYYTSKRWEGSSKLYIKDQIFNNFIKLCIQGGYHSYDKHISSFLYQNSNKETLKGILDGILVGDGMLKKEYNVSLNLTSEKLIYDSLYISNILGVYNVSLKKGKSISPINSENWRNSYTLSWLNSSIDNEHKIFSKRVKDWERKNTIGKSNYNNRFEFKNDKPYVSLNINDEIKEIQVYNLEIENTHTYVTEYGIAHNCDCSFNTSGDVVFHNDWIQYALDNTCQEPKTYRGIDNNLWIWEEVNYSKDYLVVADVARGDGADYSTFHVLDIKSNTQVAEYKGQMSTREFGYFLVSIATEYNNALLVVENNNIGWSVIEAILERGYRNLYHSSKNELKNQEDFISYGDEGNNTPGFYMNLQNRPICINKLREYIGERSLIIRSTRLISEMKVFIWKNGRAQAQSGYNDDLVMPMAVGMFLRDTALRFQSNNLDMTRATLNAIKGTNYNAGVYSPKQYQVQNPYGMDVNGEHYDLKWLITKRKHG